MTFNNGYDIASQHYKGYLRKKEMEIIVYAYHKAIKHKRRKETRQLLEWLPDYFMSYQKVCDKEGIDCPCLL